MTIAQNIGREIGSEYFDNIIGTALARGYRFVDYDEIDRHQKAIVLRHDIDVEPLLSLELGKMEVKRGVFSTYYVMLRNPLYNTFAPKYVNALKELAEMGHRIGLHFDASCYPTADGPRIISCIESELRLLSEILAPTIPSKFVSFHKPNPYILENDLSGQTFVSTYSSRFFTDVRYISDSCGQWRQDSILEVLTSGDSPKIQFTSHPIWWTLKGKTVSEKLESLLKFKWQELQEDLAETINDRRRGIVLFSMQPKTA